MMQALIMTLTLSVIQHLNAERSAAGLQSLSPNYLLMQAAQQHADFMYQKQSLTHTGINGAAFDVRIKATGYIYAELAENIALGPANAETIVRMWMNDPPHKANILNRKVTELGIGISPLIVPDNKAEAAPRFWSASFAKPLEEKPTAP
jgi:uncharacterized protein YkwD